ncbi:hypothetical protein CRYUN_Cryun23aG0068000 [Craigia yunnanensis]
MKRRYHDFNPEDPSPIPTSSPAAALPNVWSPLMALKLMSFTFFKKLKKDGGQRIYSHSMRREKNQSNKLNSSELCRVVEWTKIVRNISKSSEGTNITRNCSKDFRSPLSVGNVSSKELGSLLAVENVSSKDLRTTCASIIVVLTNHLHQVMSEFEINLKNAFSAFESIFNIEDWLEHDINNKKPGGSQSDQAELFPRKRQKLRQWVHNSFPEIEELCSKGYDLISMLLSWLLPWSNEKKDCSFNFLYDMTYFLNLIAFKKYWLLQSCRSAESAPVESNTKTELLACPMSDIPSKKPYRFPKRNIMEVEYMPYLENDTSSYRLDKSSNETSDTLPYPGNHLGFRSEGLGEENRTLGFGTHLSFALGVEWKCLQSSGLKREQCSSTYNDLQFPEKGTIYSNFPSEDEYESSSAGSSYRSLMSSEDMLDIQDWRSFYFQISPDKDKAYPFLLDKSSWEDCIEETYDSDSQVKCI